MPYESKYVKTDPVKIDQERFLYMLEVLPPSRWYRGDHMEWFHVCERLTMNLVSWYARVGDTYWEFNDADSLTKEEVRAKLLKATSSAEEVAP